MLILSFKALVWLVFSQSIIIERKVQFIFHLLDVLGDISVRVRACHHGSGPKGRPRSASSQVKSSKDNTTS